MRVLIPAALVVVVTLIAVAVARTLSPDISLASDPLESGTPAEVSLSTSLGPSVTGELHSVQLDLARGFAFDPRAATACSLRSARGDGCSNNSRIGTGSGRIRVEGTFLPRTEYNVKLAVYLTAPVQRGDLAGMLLDVDEPQSQLSVSLLGDVTRVRSGRYGLRVRFTAGGSTHPHGYQLTLAQLTLDLFAQRHTAGGITYNLLTNPRSCTRSGWPLQLTISSSGRTHVFQVSSPCHGHR